MCEISIGTSPLYNNNELFNQKDVLAKETLSDATETAKKCKFISLCYLIEYSEKDNQFHYYTSVVVTEIGEGDQVIVQPISDLFSDQSKAMNAARERATSLNLPVDLLYWHPCFSSKEVPQSK